MTPKELCHHCYVDKCDWNADYIEAILSYSDFSLDDILIEFVTGKIEEREALFRINALIRQVDSDVKIQVVLREKALKFMNFVRSYKLEE